MENPTDRVTYGDLRMIREEFEELMQLSIEAGTIKHPIAYETYMDESFVQRAEAGVDPAVIRRTRHCSLLLGTAARVAAGAAPPRRSRPAC